MRTIKNTPATYVKRSDLVCRPQRLSVGCEKIDPRAIRDFSSAPIDSNFYVLFPKSDNTKVKK